MQVLARVHDVEHGSPATRRLGDGVQDQLGRGGSRRGGRVSPRWRYLRRHHHLHPARVRLAHHVPRLHHLHAALVSLTRPTSRLGLGHLLLARLAGRHWRHENVTGRAPAADHLPVDEQEQPASRRAAQHCAPEDIVVYARVAWRNLLPVKRIAIAHVRPAKLVLLSDSPFDARDRRLLDSRAVGACHAL